jgi:hypothetical protein
MSSLGRIEKKLLIVIDLADIAPSSKKQMPALRIPVNDIVPNP